MLSVVNFLHRTEELGDVEALKRREKRAEDHFEQLWTAEGAHFNREMLQKNSPDACTFSLTRHASHMRC